MSYLEPTTIDDGTDEPYETRSPLVSDVLASQLDRHPDNGAEPLPDTFDDAGDPFDYNALARESGPAPEIAEAIAADSLAAFAHYMIQEWARVETRRPNDATTGVVTLAADDEARTIARYDRGRSKLLIVNDSDQGVLLGFGANAEPLVFLAGYSATTDDRKSYLHEGMATVRAVHADGSSGTGPVRLVLVSERFLGGGD